MHKVLFVNLARINITEEPTNQTKPLRESCQYAILRDTFPTWKFVMILQ